VSTLPRSGESVRRAIALKIPLTDHDTLREAQLCVLAVPDSAVAQAAELVDEDLSPTAALVHCSGALTLTAFGQAPLRSGRPLGSFHPLVAVSDPHDSIEGAAVAIAATPKELLPVLQHLAEALRLRPIEVPETGRAAYHAGAVMSAGLMVALAEAAVSAMEHAGLNRAHALEALLPLMNSALRGVAQRGLEKGLTGPVVRGDVAVVQSHLEALPAELGAIYRLLSRRALKLTSNLPSETKLALERILA
jgi:predicted short-subunit dehydrogenase-like oxidoreductase (DUF2520 family)